MSEDSIGFMQIKNGEIAEGKVTGITKYGAFVNIANENGETSGMIHISEISDGFIKDINEFLEINQTVKVVVIGINENGKLALSLKQVPKTNQANSLNKPDEKNMTAEKEKPDIKSKTPEEFVKTGKNPEAPRSFEDMISKFKRESDEKISDLKHLEPKRSGQPRRRKD